VKRCAVGVPLVCGIACDVLCAVCHVHWYVSQVGMYYVLFYLIVSTAMLHLAVMMCLSFYSVIAVSLQFTDSRERELDKGIGAYRGGTPAPRRWRRWT
jgi:hypothetical protein